ncbi:MAG: hypothetical protein BGO13_06885 [Burkholderiales bacterium 66-5]|uniref:copper resistance CopC/CopD family protein n=1 Tax=Comamonas badia TaxID=265291 RepID=UPI0004203797|nr:CopD family protein [Comamonas badia]OJU91554.1 MAG: hypothetical protein BGO13_06885 [Burkholderiales bacterium 66-5]
MKPAPLRWLCALLRALLLGMLLPGGAAWAHTALLHAEPADGSVLAQAPRQALLAFSEPVTVTRLQIVEPDGSALPVPGARTEGAQVQVPIPALARGGHALVWHVISADGHPVSGVLRWSVGAGAAPAAPAAAASATPLGAAIWLAKCALYLGLFLGAGTAFWCAWNAPACTPSTRRLGSALLALGLVSALLAPLLQGADMLGLALHESASWQAWRTGAQTSLGATLALAGAALLLGLCALRGHGGRLARGAGLLALLGSGAALSASGHASTAPYAWARAAVSVHATSVALWLGALIPLATSLRRPGADAPRLLARFSRAIPWVLAALVLAGLALASIQLGDPRALYATAYGRVLLAKLALVALVLVLAAWHRWRLTPALMHGQTGTRRRMARSIAIETGMLAAVLAVVALWRFTPPPRSLPPPAAAAAKAQPAHLVLDNGQVRIDLVIAPAAAGPVSITATLAPGTVAPREVAFVLANPALGIEALHAQAHATAPGRWRADAVLIPAAGEWTVRAELLLDEFTQTALQGTVAIAR